MNTNHPPMYIQESEKLKQQLNPSKSSELDIKLSTLIGIYNVFSDIEKVFTDIPILRKYFDEAEYQVLSDNNQGLGTIYAVTLKNIAEALNDYHQIDEEDNN